ncbi:MAG TPA: hypothetical protein VM537_17780 [Anaerolineae bacterium]|nr:hypothetical protein [Anaerolineae bacterium]
MCSNLEETIRATAENAKNLLGQLGPLAWALHSHHTEVGPTAILLSVDPETFVRIRVPDPCDKIRKGVVDCLEALRRGVTLEDAPRLFRSEGLRETINRSIVVYAVAVLEQFLDAAARDVYTRKGGKDWKDSFGARVRCLSCVGIDLYDCDHYPQAALLALYRHKIVHVDGRMDYVPPVV